MKKLKIWGAVVIFAAALGVNASFDVVNNESKNVVFSDLANVGEANAECNQGTIKNGKCINFTGRCALSPFPEDQDCDFYAN